MSKPEACYFATVELLLADLRSNYTIKKGDYWNRKTKELIPQVRTGSRLQRFMMWEIWYRNPDARQEALRALNGQ